MFEVMLSFHRGFKKLSFLAITLTCLVLHNYYNIFIHETPNIDDIKLKKTSSGEVSEKIRIGNNVTAYIYHDVCIEPLQFGSGNKVAIYNGKSETHTILCGFWVKITRARKPTNKTYCKTCYGFFLDTRAWLMHNVDHMMRDIVITLYSLVTTLQALNNEKNRLGRIVY